MTDDNGEVTEGEALRLIMKRLGYPLPQAVAWLKNFKRRHGTVRPDDLQKAIDRQKVRNDRYPSPFEEPDPDVGQSFEP